MLSCPVTLSVLTYIVVLRLRSYLSRNFNPMHVYFNYENLVNRKQHWRVLTSALCHESGLHVLLNVVALWSFKFVEQQLGSLRYLGYSLIFMAMNRWIAILIGYLDATHRVRGYFLSSIGYSDVVIAWSSYVAVHNFRTVVYIMDVFPVSSYIVSLVLLNLALLFSSVVNRPLLPYIALFTGGAVGFGFDLLPTNYWAFSLIADASLIFLWSYIAFPNSQQSEGSEVESNVDQTLEDALRLSREAAFGTNVLGSSSASSQMADRDSSRYNSARSSSGSFAGDDNNV